MIGLGPEDDGRTTPRARGDAQFSPHVLMVPLTLVLTLPLVRGAIVSGMHWWHADSYRQATYVMEAFQANGGAPFISGHLAGQTEPRRLTALVQEGGPVVKSAPAIGFVRGAELPVWHSDAAPDLMVFNDGVNDIPLAAMPKRPGGFSFIIYLCGIVGALAIGGVMTMWVAARFSRDLGAAATRRRNG